ncbi:hypothetical protein Mapa_007820 [Marchantia paleacea]|nr:hypothetical protein Mapa_007820 [Marchantia paleacea]
MTGIFAGVSLWSGKSTTWIGSWKLLPKHSYSEPRLIWPTYLIFFRKHLLVLFSLGLFARNTSCHQVELTFKNDQFTIGEPQAA